MNLTFGILTVVFIILSTAMVLVILVQRPSGGGLAGAFGGAGGGGTDTVFGGRVGDALTVVTTIAFVVWLGLAVALNLVESEAPGQQAQQPSVQQPVGTAPEPGEGGSTPGQQNPDGTNTIGNPLGDLPRSPEEDAASNGATGGAGSDAGDTSGDAGQGGSSDNDGGAE